ncbi:MAG TPA: transcription-repair coupling factor [Chthonomonadales bacterium]|nr:transcription-repair coupling factor [Chthonomonadales bacterium]
MTLDHLPHRADRVPGLDRLAAALLTTTGASQIEGLAGPARALVVARLRELRGGPILLITHQFEQAQRFWDDLRAFGVPEALLHLMPAPEGMWFSAQAVDHRAVGERIGALAALGAGGPCVVIGSGEAAFQRTCAPEELLGDAFTLRVGETVALEEILRRLVDLGYDADTTVSRPGQFARRGGILDIFPITANAPVRMELFGDEVESLRRVDVSTQRSTGAVDTALIYAARELRLAPERVERALPLLSAAIERRKIELVKARNREAFEALVRTMERDIERLRSCCAFDGVEEYAPFLLADEFTALDYLAAGARAGGPPPLVVLDEPGQIERHAERLRSELAAVRERRHDRGELLQGAERVPERLVRPADAAARFSTLVLSHLPRVYDGLEPRERLSVSSAQMSSYRARLPLLVTEVQTWLANDAECLIVSDQPQRVREICRELGLPVASPASDEPEGGAVHVIEGRLRQGFKLADAGLFVATDAELFGSARAVDTRRRATTAVPISTLLDLREGDYVVHIHHGIGIYRGLVRRRVDDAERDFLAVQYAGADRLYVPADQIDRLQRYVGAEAAPPPVNRIGGNEWQRTTRRVQEQARTMARELIDLYAARQAAERPSYGADTPWQAEMEDAFPYEETPSQLRAIEDVKADLEESRPMDRLVCGDVGFGKTEVAIRAAFKVLEAGKQVGVLCPTTVLAAQHYTTFSERLAAYPVKVELLSRFRSRAEQQRTVERLKAGVLDIVVGTHRLLSKDVQFEKLGLLIVDEEQRFGVAQKERLKLLRKSVDVLTLTATPIPRTLSMALSGLRDMSVIDDPPAGRVPISTMVREHDDELVRDAVLRELERDGQVYYVYNRVESIEYVAERLRKLAPDARIRVGHGQMSEDELERIMVDFYSREYDVLVCTTIIENGLDLPNVNTIIVDHADKMGLAQLYQLRGRVGRASRQAYAYLLYRPHKQLSEISERRLLAIRDYTALGSGYQIAMRDLEIRGAGNLLGAEQSGLMISVGFDLYCQLLAQAVAELQGEEPVEDTLPPVDLPVTAHIPNDYIPNEAERIFFYKRMAGVRSAGDIASLHEELDDRYGDPPRPVWTAFEIMRLRLKARQAGIASVRGERGSVSVRFRPDVRLSAEAVRLLTHAFRDHRFLSDSVTIGIAGRNVMREVEEMLDVLERAVAESREGKVVRR